MKEHAREIRQRALAVLAATADVETDLFMRQERTRLGEDPEQWQAPPQQPKAKKKYNRQGLPPPPPWTTLH
jgi:hypothetical protein